MRSSGGHPSRRARIGTAAVVLAACCSAGALLAASPTGAAKPQSRPNVIVIMTDDQTVGQMRFMPKVRQLIRRRGVSFPNSYVSNPQCCPSRATFLTGQYSFNNGVHSNGPPNGGYRRLKHRHTIAVALRRSGYFTAQIGKYLNGYERTPQPRTVPPGWSSWRGVTRAYRYYDYQLNDNRHLVNYGNDPGDYQGDVFTDLAVQMIQAQAPKRRPFFLWLNYLAPHRGGPIPNPNQPKNCRHAPQPAVRDADAFAGLPLPRGRAFNERNVSDKPPFLRQKPRLDAAKIASVRRLYQCEVASLQAVDDGVARLISALRQTGDLSRTYVFFTSDNGFFHGEHRFSGGKRQFFEPSVRVPLVARGPSIAPGSTVGNLVMNGDLAPTIATLAGLRKRASSMDGISLLHAIHHRAPASDRELYLEGTKPRWQAVRNRRFIYVRYRDGHEQLYDLRRDPDELRSLHAVRRYARVRHLLARRLRALSRCRGRRCHTHAKLDILLVQRSPRGGDEKCRRRVLHVGARSRSGPLRRVVFTIAGTVRTDRRKPFRVSVPRSAGRGRVSIRLVAELADGRRAARRAHARICS